MMASTSRIVVMAPHKAASTLFRTLLQEISRLSGQPYYCQDLGNFPTHWLLETDTKPIEQVSGLIGPLRTFSPIADIENTHIILQLRDPLDVMVSLYHSFGYLHAAPPGIDVTDDRRRWQAIGIDKFVTEDPVIWGPAAFRRSFAWQAVLDRYRSFSTLIGKPNVSYLRYEQAFDTPDIWWATFITPFRGMLSADQQDEIYRLFMDEVTIPAEENITRHKRRMRPGDYKEKLAPETIAFLREKFSAVQF